LLILDEAHHAAPSSGGKYGIETKFTRAVRDLAARFEHRLFLSATPHNGHSNSFSTLLEILDPYRFTRGVKVRGKRILEDVMVRRLKEDIRSVQGGFPRRDVVRVEIAGLPADAPELELSRLLDEYRELREERHKGTSKRARAAAGLLIVGLQQRLLSSIEAFARTLKVHRRTVAKQWDREREADVVPEAGTDRLLPADELQFLSPPDSDDERAAWSADELEAEEAAQVIAVTAAAEAESPHDERAMALWAKERALLDRMERITDESRHLPDAKMRRLIDWIRENLCPELPNFGDSPSCDAPRWNQRRVLIFTENREGTKRRLKAGPRQVALTPDRHRIGIWDWRPQSRVGRFPACRDRTEERVVADLAA
jgi:hypothetical protein